MITSSRKEEIRDMVESAIRSTRHWGTSVLLLTIEETEYARGVGSNFGAYIKNKPGTCIPTMEVCFPMNEACKG